MKNADSSECKLLTLLFPTYSPDRRELSFQMKLLITNRRAVPWFRLANAPRVGDDVM